MHLYKCTPNERPTRSTLETASEGRKAAHTYPSVTTVLGLYKDSFIEHWRGEQMHKLASAGMDLEQAKAALWGMRTCPETGDEIESSLFGTNAHGCMEDWANGKDVTGSAYYATCKETIAKLKEMKAVPWEAEYIVSSHVDECAGTVDLIAQVKGKPHLFDYKFRNGTGKFYQKDCAQLAIEAVWLQDLLGLDEMPSCTSICINADTGETSFKTWSNLMIDRGIGFFRGLRLTMKHANEWRI